MAELGDEVAGVAEIGEMMLVGSTETQDTAVGGARGLLVRVE